MLLYNDLIYNNSLSLENLGERHDSPLGAPLAFDSLELRVLMPQETSGLEQRMCWVKSDGTGVCFPGKVYMDVSKVVCSVPVKRVM